MGEWGLRRGGRGTLRAVLCSDACGTAAAAAAAAACGGGSSKQQGQSPAGGVVQQGARLLRELHAGRCGAADSGAARGGQRHVGRRREHEEREHREMNQVPLVKLARAKAATSSVPRAVRLRPSLHSGVLGRRLVRSYIIAPQVKVSLSRAIVTTHASACAVRVKGTSERLAGKTACQNSVWLARGSCETAGFWR